MYIERQAINFIPNVSNKNMVYLFILVHYTVGNSYKNKSLADFK